MVTFSFALIHRSAWNKYSPKFAQSWSYADNTRWTYIMASLGQALWSGDMVYSPMS
jgi:hypothetical protein